MKSIDHAFCPSSETPRYARLLKMRLAMYQWSAVEIGAGEGIRTLDPDLGKVVLYP